MSVSFGNLIRRGREEAGLSQSRLATLIGRSATTIRAWEHGRTNPSDRQSVSALAAVLGLDENELLGEAGFEPSEARTPVSARQELTSLATERTEMIALVAPDGHKPSGSSRPPPPRHSRVSADASIVTGPAPEDEVVEMPLIKAPPPAPEAPAPDVPAPKAPADAVPPATEEREPPTPEIPKAKEKSPLTTKPKPRVVLTHRMAPGPSPGGSNGFVSGISYIEDEAEKDFYRRRGAITAVVLAFMVIFIWWAFGRTGSAIGDFFESIIGSLDI